jgi:hypothetical protein
MRRRSISASTREQMLLLNISFETDGNQSEAEAYTAKVHKHEVLT